LEVLLGVVYSTNNPIHIALLLYTHPTTTNIYTLSLHDALPISKTFRASFLAGKTGPIKNGTSLMSPILLDCFHRFSIPAASAMRSEEHTSELQSLRHLVCRLLLEKKKLTSSYSDIDVISLITSW